MSPQEKHEVLAQIAAYQNMLIDTMSDALAHLECVVGAMLLTMDTQTRGNVISELQTFEQLSPDILSVVQLYGETDSGIKPQRQAWRDELAALKDQIVASDSSSDD